MRKIAMLAFTACAACSLLVDTDDLTSATHVASDAGSDSAVPLPAEAGLTSSHDAGGDASADAAPARFCASHTDALLCDDFDQPGRTDLRTEGWTPLDPTDPMSTPTTAQFFSPPASARNLWDWQSPGTPGSQGSSRTAGVPSSVREVKISLRVRPELSVAANQQVLAVSLRSCLLYASFNRVGMRWQDEAGDVGEFTVPFEKWTLFSFDIKVRNDGCDTTTTVGEGVSAIVLPKTVNVVPTGDLPSIAAIDLGYTATDAVGAVSFDDVLFVAVP